MSATTMSSSIILPLQSGERKAEIETIQQTAFGLYGANWRYL